MKHYTYGGSTAARTIGCPSWRDYCENVPAGKESDFAAEGTRLHDVMEDVLEHGAGEPADEPLVSEALLAWDELCKQYGVTDYLVEQTFHVSDDTGGTADVVALGPNRLIIVDWKFGQGIKVEAEGNAQALFYAMCAEVTNPEWFGPDIELSVAIIQPMPSRGLNALSVWDVPKDVFELYKKTYGKSVSASGLNTGSHCQFCPAAPVCPLKTGEAKTALAYKGDDLAQLKNNLDLAMELEEWVRTVKRVAHEQLEEGVTIEGYKLVPKRATRKWIDEDQVLEVMTKQRKVKKADYLTSKLLSPAKLEKLVDKGTLSAYIQSVSSGTTLATEEDSREGVVSSGALKSALDRLS